MSKIETGPAQGLVAITPHNSTNFTVPIRGFHVGGAGNVAIVDMKDVVTVVVGCQVGSYYPYACKRINSTNTTATSLVGIL